jgi:hypothetical protein
VEVAILASLSLNSGIISPKESDNAKKRRILRVEVKQTVDY